MKRRYINSHKLFGLLVVVVILQAIGLGIVLKYGGEVLEKNRTVYDRTSMMVNETFPEIKSGMEAISQKATDIKNDVQGLRDQITQVDRQVNEINKGVVTVGTQIEGVQSSITGFVHDTSGLIWGHSLNPYVLVGILICVGASVPFWGWFFAKKSESCTPYTLAQHDLTQNFSDKLDQLSFLMEKIRSEDSEYPVSPELKELMEQTERLIYEARLEIAKRSECVQPLPKDLERPRTLH